MNLVLALTDAQEYTITAVAIWFVLFPAFVTGLIALAIGGTLRERAENQDDIARRRRG
jgi:hypothetical protein